VYIGRISPEKRIETMIEILRQVRERGHDVHLHVIGPIIDHTPYGRMVRQLCEANSTWIKAEGSQSGAAKAQLLAKHRFGINACTRETFGIAVAEMIAAGCITFVPNEGGPVEIVGNDSLCYQDVDDAVEKIDAVLRNSDWQSELVVSLAGRAERFSTTRFMQEFRSVVENFAKRSSRN
jgi:glycosyltransferase involved in cell wall biosynthesis